MTGGIYRGTRSDVVPDGCRANPEDSSLKQLCVTTGSKGPACCPPPKPPPDCWTSDPILTSLFPSEMKDSLFVETGSGQDTATTMDMDEETMTTVAEMAGDLSDWSVDSDDENDDEGKPTYYR